MRRRSFHAGLKARFGGRSRRFIWIGGVFLASSALASTARASEQAFLPPPLATAARQPAEEIAATHRTAALVTTQPGKRIATSVDEAPGPAAAAAPVSFDRDPPAPPTDPLGMDMLLEPPAADAIDLTSLDAGDWRPEHALSPEKPKRHAGRDGDRSLDPEPDAAIRPPSSAPSTDPLDHPRSAPTTGAGLPPPDQGKLPAQQAEAPLPPANAAIKAALDRRDAVAIKGPHAAELRKEREAVDFFYAAHGFAPAWSEGGKPVGAVSSVLARLARAGDDALTLAAVPKSLSVDGPAPTNADSDVALTESVVDYARQASGSRLDPRTISPLIGARRELADPAEVLDSLIAAGAEAGDRLQALNPGEPRYVALREKLAEIRGARMPSVDAHIPQGPILRVGMRDPRVPLIRSRFSLGVTGEGDQDDLRYDTEVAAAVADFQRANGLPPSGNLTKRTIAALSGGQPSRLEATIIANMEMWRWMPRDLGADRIEVNVPQFTATVFHDGDAVASNRVVVGKTNTPTPLFSNVMKYLIVNPVWNVPESIIKKEFIPKSGGDPSYLAAHGFDVSYRNGQLVVKQPSGARNALGRIKFMFPNDYSVYLHDTPSKSLFAASKRAFSHGCVRVDQPFAFAESVLNDGVPEGGEILWSQKRLQKMLGDKERYVYLPKALPIHIEYFTATVDPDTGRLQLHDDVYDYARRVELALGPEG